MPSGGHFKEDLICKGVVQRMEIYEGASLAVSPPSGGIDLLPDFGFSLNQKSMSSSTCTKYKTDHAIPLTSSLYLHVSM